MRFILPAVALAGLLQSVHGEPISLEPLEPITWTLQEDIEDSDTPLAMALRASGKRLDVHFRDDVSVATAPFYSDPLTCVAAGITAIIDTEEAWWGDLAARAEDRAADGTPDAGYSADSGENLYTMFTFHTENPQMPRAVDAEIVTYLRIGGMHAFDVRWSEVVGQTALPPVNSVLAVEEFAPGKFRMAPEWFSPAATLYPMFENTEFQDATLDAYRTAAPALSHEVEIHNLFGGENNAFPLTLLFRGAAEGQAPVCAEVADRKQAISAVIAARHGAVLEGAPPATYDDVASLFTPESLVRYQQQSESTQIQLPFVKDTTFVIDGGDILLAYGRDADTGELSPHFATFVREEDELLLANYAMTTLLRKFLSDTRVWTPLSHELESIISGG